MKTLTEIANAYGTDKGTALPDHHGYTDVYEPWCAVRAKRALAILEIGVLSGASLRMWRDYFPRALIYGIDVDPRAREIGHGEGRIIVNCLDQADANELGLFAHNHGPFDLIVDDGSHESDAQMISLAVLLSELSSGGRYCIEDVTEEQPAFQLVAGIVPTMWGAQTRERMAALQWTMAASRYPGRFVVIGDKK